MKKLLTLGAADGDEEKIAAHPREKGGGERGPYRGKLIWNAQRTPESGDFQDRGCGKNSAAGTHNTVRDQDCLQLDCGGKKGPISSIRSGESFASSLNPSRKAEREVLRGRRETQFVLTIVP